MTYNTVVDDNERRKLLNAQNNPRVTTPNEGTQELNPITRREYADRKAHAMWLGPYDENGGVFDLHATLAYMDARDGKNPYEVFHDLRMFDIAIATLPRELRSTVTDGASLDAFLCSSEVQRKICEVYKRQERGRRFAAAAA